LAHDSLGETKGRWWEHTAPESALSIRNMPSIDIDIRMRRTRTRWGEGDDQVEPEAADVKPQMNYQQTDGPHHGCHLKTLFNELTESEHGGLSSSRTGHVRREGVEAGEKVVLGPFPAVNISLPVPPISLPPVATKCYETILAIQASYVSHAWLQQNADLFPVVTNS